MQECNYILPTFTFQGFLKNNETILVKTVSTFANLWICNYYWISIYITCETYKRRNGLVASTHTSGSRPVFPAVQVEWCLLSIMMQS